MRSKRAHVRVIGAVVGRGVQIDQVFRSRDDGASCANLQLASLAQPDFGGRIVLGLEVVADFAEAGQLLPTRDQGTGARDAVALASYARLLDDGLGIR